MLFNIFESDEWSTFDYIKMAGAAVFCLVLLNLIYSTLQAHYSMRKLGAYPATHVLSDGALGFLQIFLAMKSRRQGLFVYKIHERYENGGFDTFQQRMAGVKIFCTRDPENIKAILATQFEEFSIGARRANFFPALGNGIFALDGPSWKHSRAMLRPQFSREQVAHVKSLEKHVQRLCQQIRASNGEVIELQNLLSRLCLDSSTEFLTGTSVESLRDEKINEPFTEDEFVPGRDTFNTNLDIFQKWLVIRYFALDHPNLINPKEFRETLKGAHEFIDYFVRMGLDCTPEVAEKRSANGYVLLYELLKITRDPLVIREQLMSVLMAGRDAVASHMSFTFFELARRPDVMAKLKEEISLNFGLGENSRVEDITFESMKRCNYLRAVLNEVLRLYPVVPINTRTSRKDTSLPRGGGKDGMSPLYVPKNTVVSYHVSSTHKMKRIYGEDADHFRPERWLEPQTKSVGWAYVPFNGGPRVCLGQQFALTEASYVVTRILQTFEHIETASLEADETMPRIKTLLASTLMNGNPIKIY